METVEYGVQLGVWVASPKVLNGKIFKPLTQFSKLALCAMGTNSAILIVLTGLVVWIHHRGKAHSLLCC